MVCKEINRSHGSRVEWIDGLKGLGCVIVYLSHFRMAGFFHFQLDNLIATFFDGAFAVSVFLIVSAYSISISFEKKSFDFYALRSMILKRYFRLSFPIALITLSIAVLYYAGLMYNKEASMVLSSPVLCDFFSKVSVGSLIKTIITSPLGLEYSWLPQGWMLRYIFWGTYIVFVLMIGMYKMSVSKQIVILLFSTFIIHYCSLYYIPVVFGIYIYIYDNNAQYSQRTCCLLAVLSLISFVCLRLYLCNTMVCNIISSMVFVFTVVNSTVIKSVLSCKTLKWLGQVSFSLYLWHMAIICSWTSFLYLKLHAMNIIFLDIILLLTTTIILLLVSYISKKVIENKATSYLLKSVFKS